MLPTSICNVLHSPELDLLQSLTPVLDQTPDQKYCFRPALFLLLKEVCRVLADYNYRIVNIDSTVIAQQPKLKPHIDEMRKNIANACGIDISLVSVKATTEEKLGFTGRLEGISAHAVCLIEKY